ncbi:hypothetical protein [Pragia fontium]|uniref:hypothetical protein n=1 Tax=Pragia fontium TaxID=82985 RepID=UPI000649E775|nr:hypothetical protein [Pragia fontium]AKJ42294.1 transcriptional regulator [Pragia fontium]
MLSQLTLRFPKKLIESLKNRATTESVSVNALTERLVESGLQSSASGDDYLRLTTDPDTAVAQLYRQLIMGQPFGYQAINRDELRFMLRLAHQGYAYGCKQLVNVSRLKVLLAITFELLAWQVKNGLSVDSHYLKGTFGLPGEDWHVETNNFIEALPAMIAQEYAEILLRPLSSNCFNLTDFPDTTLAKIFTTSRLKAIFPLIMRSRDWSYDQRRQFIDKTRPMVTAMNHSIEAGTLRLDIRITGKGYDERPGGWYEPPRLYMLISGQEFTIPYDWEHFSELLRILTIYQHNPEALPYGYQGYNVMFSPPGYVSKDGFFGIEALRVFLPAEAFSQLVNGLTNCSDAGSLADTLESLRYLYGDL